MTSGRYSLNGEDSGSEQNSAASNPSGVSSVGSCVDETTEVRENEKVKTFVFTSRCSSSSSIEISDRTHSSARAVNEEELEIKIPEVKKRRKRKKHLLVNKLCNNSSSYKAVIHSTRGPVHRS